MSTREPWEQVPRLALAHLPTPLAPARRLGAALGLKQLWIKHDDLTGIGPGGNKARKLEYLLAAAQAEGADTIVTIGAAQSNHASMTAAAAARLGMETLLVLSGAAPARAQGNLLLNRLVGARILFTERSGWARQEIAVAEAARLRAQGRRPYVVPMGGSSALSTLGYVRAVQELAGQAEAGGLRFRRVFFACGSGGTHAGILLGARLFLRDLQVIGVGVGDPVAWLSAEVLKLARATVQAYGLGAAPARGDLTLLGDYGGPDYGVATDESREAVRLAARTEGLLLDPFYTGKALAALADQARTGQLDPEEPVLFWHTGGTAGLYAGWEG